MSGKGDAPRPVDRKKYEHGWLKIFGVPCPRCNPKGHEAGKRDCLKCGGNGWCEK